MQHFKYTLFGSTYGCGTYNSSTYNASCSGTSTSTTNNSSSTSGGTLTNTGLDIAVGVTLACVIIFVALAVKFWKKPKK
jgi:hypothetical protein